MNYYPFHLGDYAAHTAHLEPMEDLAYRRMLDLYYRTEKPLPSDWRDIARLIRMREYGPAIEAVLSEFFTLTDDGWHNKRADDEIVAMREKAVASEEKDAHERARMARYRERRSVMFDALRKFGIVPAWDVPMQELQRLYDANCNRPATDLQREQVVLRDAPATAIPIPTPTPKEEDKARKRATPPSCPQGVTETVWSDWLALRKAKKAPATQTVIDGAVAEAAKAGMSLDAFLRVWCSRGSQGLQAEWLKPQERGFQPARAGPDPAEVTRAMLDAQKQTPEERAAAEEARKRVMSGIRKVS